MTSEELELAGPPRPPATPPADQDQAPGDSEATIAPDGQEPNAPVGGVAAEPQQGTASVHQGRTAVLPLDATCADASTARLIDPASTASTANPAGGRPLIDGDDDPTSFSFATTDLALGTYGVVIDCGQGRSIQSNVLLFRQNGAERGGANSIVVASSIGLGSTFALLGLPAMLSPLAASGSLGGRRRVRDHYVDRFGDGLGRRLRDEAAYRFQHRRNRWP